MKVNMDLDVQDFFTPNQSLNSLNTYQESFPRIIYIRIGCKYPPVFSEGPYSFADMLGTVGLFLLQVSAHHHLVT